MKRLLLLAGLLACSIAHADPLSDANALFAKKAYPEALAAYAKLANAGNVEAQQHLGEMYLYGEAGTADEAKAEQWFRKAAAKGNAVALASLDLIRQRGARRDDIAYWTTNYDGAELKAGKFHCVTPRIPSISKQKEEIERVSNAISKWQACHNGFVDNLNAASPLVKQIPEDIAKLMNAAETERARVHVTQVQDNLAEEAKIDAKLLLADIAVWRGATEAYVSEHNAIMANAPSEERARDVEARKSNYAPQK
jgi:TPR repeat protein